MQTFCYIVQYNNYKFLNNPIKICLQFALLCIGLAFVQGCSTQKNTATNRGLQNLSARYNYIYNSNVLLTAFQDELSQNYKDNYDAVLNVYIAPPSSLSLETTATPNDKSLDEITLKAQAIIAEKGLSNYTDEAYLLLAKTNFYKGSYFTAAAYFDYTAKAYKTDKKVLLTSLTWKARSLMQLNDDKSAITILDTVKIFLDSVKKDKADSYATLAQMSIDHFDYKKAVPYLEHAIKENNRIQDKIRWEYILAQLYEREKQYDESLRHYAKVESSNAPFEMYFNSKLSKIRINDLLSGQTSSRRQQLSKLLKDDKNLDFIDQIYYEIAEDYLSKKDFANAEKYYKTSVLQTTTNGYQKGLSYLKLAELNFKEIRNYVNAKLYYDSAANSLPKTYIGYDAIVTKGQNLEYLTDRYQQIAKQDSLQSLARMPQQEREKALNELFTVKVAPTSIIADMKIPIGNETEKNQTTGTFYFNNTSALGRGAMDFRKRWGNRVLQDNWRQSVKSSSQVNQQNQANVIDNANLASTNASALGADEKAGKIAAYSANLPLTSAQMTQSDQLIIDAFFEIATFYQQVLNDQEEAINVYETLLKRYPKNNHLEAVYYSLYLEYATLDKGKSEDYKKLVLTQFPNSAFAKTILDPNFSTKQNELDLEVHKNYNGVYDNYDKKDYQSVITAAKEANQRFPGNILQAQYDYLSAIAIGRTQPVDSLLNAFNTIVIKYPDDKLIYPLVKAHLSYLNENIAVYKPRKIALPHGDPSEPKFIAPQEQIAVVVPKQEPVKQEQANVLPVITDSKLGLKAPQTITSVIVPQVIAPPVQTASNPIAKADSVMKAPTIDNYFSTAESSIYYYVVNVADVSSSVSSSRFGIGQFNRGNFSGTGIKHQLQELAEDQLIYVGDFNSISEVKAYSIAIAPELPKIMKVPLAKYKGFFISKENFEKITNRETLSRYLEFFKRNNY